MLKRNLVANYVGQGWIALMGIAFIPAYIKYLGAEAFGLIGVFTLMQACLALLDMGMSPTLSRELARFSAGIANAQHVRNLVCTVEILACSLAAFVATVVFLSSNWMASSWLQAEGLPVESVGKACAIMGGVAALRLIEGVYRGCLMGLQRQVLFNSINCATATLRNVGAVAILAWVSPSIEAFFWWNGALSLLNSTILSLVTYANLPRLAERPRFSVNALRETWKFAGGVMGITCLAFLLTQMDKILLSNLLVLSEYGYYTIASIVATSLHLLVSPITQAWFPRFAQLHAANEHDQITAEFHFGAQLVSVIVGSAATVIFLYADMLLLLWTQDEVIVDQTTCLLRLLIVGNLINGLMAIPYQMQLAFGWTRLALKINIAAVLFVIPMLLWVTPRYGAEGAAMIWIALTAGYMIFSTHFMHKSILPKEKWSWYYHDILFPLAAITVVVGAYRWLAPVPEGNFGQISTLVFISAVAVVTAILATSQIRPQFSKTLTAQIGKLLPFRNRF